MTPRDAAVESIRRMKAAWPAWSWAADMEREYGQALMAVGDPELIEAGTTRAIRDVSGRFPPPLADLLAIIDRCRVDRATERSRRAHRALTADEGALRDAIASLSYVRDHDEREMIDAQIRGIRERLPDRGARVDADEGLRVIEAAPDPYDPPGTVRFVVIQPDSRRLPPGARLAGEV